ncbi:hypothetical protein ADG881_462 [Alcanivorax sp. DG881]|nr:hypothetical protein ADG881_462 [Alcanivorax sp. DG881]
MLFFFWAQPFLPVAVAAGDLPPLLLAARVGAIPVEEVMVVRCLKP